MSRSRVAAVVVGLTAFASGMLVVAVSADPTDPAPESAVRFPAGYTGDLYVGDEQVWPTVPDPSDGSSTTSSTEAPSTSTSSPTTSTSTSTPPTSSTSPPVSSTTTTVVPATTTTTPGGTAGCGLLSAAFCEAFDQPRGNGTQTGDLDPVIWGVSRLGDFNNGQGIFNAVVPSHNACDGGGTTGDPTRGDANSRPFGPATPPPNDVQICNGQMVESVNDGHGVATLATYPKQPFSFAGRTGTVVFDHSADSSGTHGAWGEFWITDEPVPAVRRSISFGIPQHAQNEIGFSIDGGCNGVPNTTGIGVIGISRGGTYTEQQGDRPNCITKGSRTAMNHFEVRLSATRLEVWGTEPGATTLKQLAVETFPALTFTQGLVWLSDTHYNARKAIESNGQAIGTQYDHSFFWDNLGWDGPKTYRDLGFDVPYANQCCKKSIGGDDEIVEGYAVGGNDPGARSFTVSGVNFGSGTTKAKVVLNGLTYSSGASISVSLNGSLAVVKASPAYEIVSLAFDFPVSAARAGNNTITIGMPNGYGSITNVSLIMVAAAPVP